MKSNLFNHKQTSYFKWRKHAIAIYFENRENRSYFCCLRNVTQFQWWKGNGVWVCVCTHTNNMVSACYWLHHIFLEMDNKYRKWEMKVFVASYRAPQHYYCIPRLWPASSQHIFVVFISATKKYYWLQFIVFKIVLHCSHDLNVNALAFISRCINNDKRVMNRLMKENNK